MYVQERAAVPWAAAKELMGFVKSLAKWHIMVFADSSLHNLLRQSGIESGTNAAPASAPGGGSSSINIGTLANQVVLRVMSEIVAPVLSTVSSNIAQVVAVFWPKLPLVSSMVALVVQPDYDVFPQHVAQLRIFAGNPLALFCSPTQSCAFGTILSWEHNMLVVASTGKCFVVR
jgi:hypothetical protein